MQLPLILAAVYTITLALAWAVPGNPVDRPEGRRPPAEVIAAMEARYNLDSFWSFYWSYLSRVSGGRWLAAAAGGDAPEGPVFDLGPSLQYRDRTVNEIIGASLPVSMLVGATAILIALVIGLGAGVLGAWRPGSWLDASTLLVALVGISVPTFVVATALQFLFAVAIPVADVGTFRLPGSLVLPSFTLSLPFAAYIARLTRMGMIEALQSDYVRTARAKGAGEARVLLVHALRNAFLPVLTTIGMVFSFMLGANVLVEKVFAWPGIGSFAIESLVASDYAPVQGFVLTMAILYVALNLVIDLLYLAIDPRVSVAG